MPTDPGPEALRPLLLLTCKWVMFLSMFMGDVTQF